MANRETDKLTDSLIASVITANEPFNKKMVFAKLTAAGKVVIMSTVAARLGAMRRDNKLGTQAGGYGYYKCTPRQHELLRNSKEKASDKTAQKPAYGFGNMLAIEKLCLYG